MMARRNPDPKYKNIWIDNYHCRDNADANTVRNHWNEKIIGEERSARKFANMMSSSPRLHDAFVGQISTPRIDRP